MRRISIGKRQHELHLRSETRQYNAQTHSIHKLKLYPAEKDDTARLREKHLHGPEKFHHYCFAREASVVKVINFIN